MKKTITLFLLIISVFLIQSCNNMNNLGTFYSLEEAYEMKLISKEDLINIAFYYNGEKQINDSSISIKEKIDLTETQEQKIKNAHADRLKDITDNIDLNLVYIKEYYGQYNNCYAVYIVDYYRAIDVYTIDEYVIDGVKFKDYTIPSIEIFII